MLRHKRWRVLLISLAGSMAGLAVLFYATVLADLPIPSRSNTGREVPSSYIVDRNGQLLYEMISPEGSKYDPQALDDLPVACREATVATEDSRFYQHMGVDPIAIVRAAIQNSQAGETVSGASTLTQQLAKNLYLSADERVELSLRRKLREAWLAWRLEQTFNKDELLDLYLNTTYYGHFAVGIEAAAQAYFGMHASDLDVAQCALLAGLPQYPAGYNPIENPEAAQARQHTVLALMVKSGYLSSEEADLAGKEGLRYASTPFPIEAPHFVMWAQAEAEQLLGAERVQEGGLRIVTTLDLDWQLAAEAIVDRRMTALQPCAAGANLLTCDPDASPDRRVDNAALVSMDPGSGAVLAMVGSPDYFDASISGAVNGTLALRQPGSAIKPLTYAAAFDPNAARAAGRSVWTPATLIADIRTAFPTQEGKPYVPQNYDLKFHGPVTVRTALANSYNVPAVKTLQHIGVDALVEQARALGVIWGATGTAAFDSALAEAGKDAESVLAADVPAADVPAADRPASDYGLALTLGGGEVRLLDLTAAYGAFANGGYRVTPHAISRIETSDGEVLYEPAGGAGGSGSPTGSPALDPRVAYLVTDILSDDDARLPAFGGGNLLEIGRPAAAKTGTTTDWRDNWTLGFTPELVTGVWVGNADNAPMQDVSGITGAGPIWHDFMVTALRDVPVTDFNRPSGLVRVEVCADSGLVPLAEAASLQTAGAPGDGWQMVPCSSRRFEWFIDGTQPVEFDESHVAVPIDIRSGAPATSETPATEVQSKTYWVLPDELQSWARANAFPQPTATAMLRTGLAATSSGGADASLRITSPDSNRSYRLNPAMPNSSQRLPISVDASTALRESAESIQIVIDGQKQVAVGAPDYTAWWELSVGEHTFQALAIEPNGDRMSSQPVTVVVVAP